jgi:hypothetical protein
MNDSVKQRLAYLVGVAGMIGGFGSWVLATVIGPQPLIDHTILAILGYMFLGTLAGLLGVFLVAKTDPTAPGHALAFSLACGIFWSPVIASVEALVVREEVEERAQQVEERAQNVEAEARSLTLERTRLTELTSDLQQQISVLENRQRQLERLRQSTLDGPGAAGIDDARIRALREENLIEESRSLNEASSRLQEIRRNLITPEREATEPPP